MIDVAIARELCAAYRDQAQHYTAALAGAGMLTRAIQGGEDTTSALEKLKDALGKIADVEARLTPAKRRWDGARLQAGTDLQGVLAHVEQLIRHLQLELQRAQDETESQRARLTPELDSLIRGRQMQRAYENAGPRTAPSAIEGDGSWPR